jgi:hypothetical protein
MRELMAWATGRYNPPEPWQQRWVATKVSEFWETWVRKVQEKPGRSLQLKKRLNGAATTSLDVAQPSTKVLLMPTCEDSDDIEMDEDEEDGDE